MPAIHSFSSNRIIDKCRQHVQNSMSLQAHAPKALGISAFTSLLVGTYICLNRLDSLHTSPLHTLMIAAIITLLTAVLTFGIMSCRRWIVLTTRRTYGSLPFWFTISLWVIVVSVCASALLFASFSFWGGAGGLHDDPAVRATAALTTTGGLGGIVFLTVRFRTQIISENEHSDRQWTAIYELLASPDQFRRASGIRELTILADTHPGRYEQRAVNAICEYLRMNHESDGVVEQLATRALKEHYSRNSEHPWHKCDLDLSGANFTQHVDFSECHFKGHVSFNAVHFLGEASFRGTAFAHITHFRNCTFDRECHFNNSEFHNDAHFEFAKFASDTTFEESIFHYSCYFGAECPEGEAPSGTFFRHANFAGCRFMGPAWFGTGVIEEDESRPTATYDGITVFNGLCEFQGAEFRSVAHFAGARWYDEARFNNRRRIAGRRRGGKVDTSGTITRFHAQADFDDTMFGGDSTSFARVKFSIPPSFRNATFRGAVDFHRSSDVFQPGFGPVEFAEDYDGQQKVIWADGTGHGIRRRQRRERRQES